MEKMGSEENNRRKRVLEWLEKAENDEDFSARDILDGLEEGNKPHGFLDLIEQLVDDRLIEQVDREKTEARYRIVRPD